MPRQTDDELIELLQNVSRNDSLLIELYDGTTCDSVVAWNNSRIRQDRSILGEIRIAIEIDSDEIPSPLDVFPNQVLRIIGKRPSVGDYSRPVFYISEHNRLTGQSDKVLDIARIDVEESTV